MPALNLPPNELVPGNGSENVSGITYVDPAAAANTGAMLLRITDSSGALTASNAGSALPGSGTNMITVSATYGVISAALSSLSYTAKIASGSDIISFDVWNQFGVETTGSIPVTIGTPPPSAGWVQSWAASPEPPDAGGDAAPSFNNQTIREVIRLSGAGTSIRLRFSNQFRTTPLAMGSVHIGLLNPNGAIVAGSDHALTFSGSNSTSIAAGSTVTSDPLGFAIGQNSLLAVSIYLPQNTGPVTWNQFGDTSPIVAGNQTGAASLSSANATLSRPILSDVEVSGGVDGAIIALGDSISVVEPDIDKNDRWTDDLSNRLQSAGVSDLAVVNAGISGNRILGDGTGPSALSRFSRDVSAPGAKYVIIEEGVNDIGSGNASAQDLEGGYVQLINAAHAAGLKVFGTTITPFGGSFYDTPAHEAVRDAVNSWIRTSGSFDGVIDFDAAVHDPKNPQWWLPQYDNGSHLHPSGAGAAALANAVDLQLFTKAVSGTPVTLAVGSGPDSLVLKISQDAFQGSAQYTISVDGNQIGGVLTASALHASGQHDTVTVHGTFTPGSHRLTVSFLEDAYGGTPTTDRNLYVDSVTINGTGVPGATAALLSAGPRSFSFTEVPTIVIDPADANPVVNLSHVNIVATSGSHSLFIGGSFDTARLTGGTEGVLAFQGHNTIVTGAGNDTIRIAGTGSVINAGGGTNHIEDSGGGNRIIMPTIGGFDDVFGYVLQNSDMLDFRPALSKTTWNGSSATLGDFLKVTMSGADATIALAPTAGGAFASVATLRASGDLDLAGLLTHSIV